MTERAPAEEWATVLAASGIPHRFALTATGWAVLVAGDDGARASVALGSGARGFGWLSGMCFV